MSENKHSSPIDWTTVDALEGAADQDNPELTAQDMARGEWHVGGKPAPKPLGRPPINGGKDLVSLRIDRDVLGRFRESGPGWQGRMNDALRKAVGL